MPRLKDPEGRAEFRRSQILAEAVLVFAEKGYHATNIADIAQRLGLGHGTFYRYFRNKLDIFDAVAERIIGEIRDLVLAETAPATSSLDEYRAQLERIGQRFMRVFEQHHRLARLVFYEGVAVDPSIAEKIRGVMALFARFTQAYLANGKQKGFLRADLDTEVTALAVNAMIFESVEHVALSPDPKATGARWQQAIIRLMLDGMRSS